MSLVGKGLSIVRRGRSRRGNEPLVQDGIEVEATGVKMG
jgi:hypothetical protein